MRQMYTHAHTHIYIHTEREVGEFWHEREWKLSKHIAFL
jgi:hypothetical protein